ncbi:hypothetical protein K3495_g5394 [Podosphaera aphanis]|nr:hypothetical protein K3495_g5394 [Podosphaera aphanis]
MMVVKLQKIQRDLQESYHLNQKIRDQVLNGCQGVPECKMALYSPAATFEGVVAQIRNALYTEEQQSNVLDNFCREYRSKGVIAIAIDLQSGKCTINQFIYISVYIFYHSNPKNNIQSFYKGRARHVARDLSPDNFLVTSSAQSLGTDQNYIERKYQVGRATGNSYVKSFSQKNKGHPQKTRLNDLRSSRQKKCYICDKSGCWSTSHSLAERKAAFSRFSERPYFKRRPATVAKYQSFLAELE